MRAIENDNGGGVREEEVGSPHAVEDLWGENERLREHLAQAESERDQLAERLRELERALEDNAILQQSSSLANLFVAGHRLHTGVDLAEVIEAIEEIVATLVGSEEMALFERHEDEPALTLLASVGIDPAPLRRIALGAGIIGRTAQTGEVHVAGGERVEEPGPAEEGLTACIPLTLAGRVTGAIAIFRMLPHKAALEPRDREMFDLLARQAGMALYCARRRPAPSAAGSGA